MRFNLKPAAVLLVLVAVAVAGMWAGVVPRPFSVVAVQPVKIQSVEDAGQYLRVTAFITSELKSVRITFPDTFPIDENRHWKFDKPIDIVIEPTAFYSVTPVGEQVAKDNFAYGKGRLCIGKRTKTLYYNRLGEPYQVLEYAVQVKQGGFTVATEKAKIAPNTPSKIQVRDITIDFPGWLNRGATPPTKDYVLKEGKVFLERTFLEDFYYYATDTTKWQGWLDKYGDCDSAYTDRQIFVEGVVDKEGNRWTPPSITMPASVTRYEVVGDEVRWYHPLLLGATGVVTITLPKDFIGAHIVEVHKVVKANIKSVDGNTEGFKGGETRTLLVTVENTGNDDGVVQLWIDAQGFYGTASDTVPSGSEKVIRLPVTATYRDSDTQVSGKVVAYAAGEIQDTYDIRLSIKGGERDTSPETGSPAERAVVLTPEKVVFKGDNVYKGSIIAIGVKKVGIETGSGLTKLTFENVHRVLIFPIMHRFTLATSDTDMDMLEYSMLLRLHVTSENVVKVYRNGEMVGKNVTEYTYTNPIAYLLALIPIALLVLWAYLPKRR